MTAVAAPPRPNADRESLSADRPAEDHAPHPSTGPNLPVETAAFAGMVRRMIRAYSRRVAAGDPEDLTVMLEVRAAFDEAIADAVAGLRSEWDASWADIGRAAGITRQSARERWGG